MLTPDQIQALGDQAAQMTVSMEEYLIRDIARRVREAGQLTSTAAYQVWRAQRLGLSRRQIEKMLRRELKVSHKRLRELLTQSAEVGYNFDLSRLPRKAVPFGENATLQQLVAASVELAKKDFTDLVQTMGLVAPDGKAYPLRKAYLKIIDFAFQQVITGTADHQTAIRQATRKLADYGLRSIDYQSGVHTSLEAAVRRNILGGLGLMQEKISQLDHDLLEADGWEISAHAASAPDHEPIQGRQYSDEAFQRLNDSLARRIGTLNCGHAAFPILLGVSQPQYTEAELARSREENARGIQYEGKRYTLYQATQKQRKLERAIRRQKRRVMAAEETGDGEGTAAAKTRLALLRRRYWEFSGAAGLRVQEERTWVAETSGPYPKNVDPRSLKNLTRDAILKTKAGGEQLERPFQTGAYTGALDPNSPEADLHSIRYYAAVREMKNDVAAIAKNTGWTEAAIWKIKRHVFLEPHDLGGTEPERFDPDYHMAVSWQRLIEGKKIHPQDVVLLKHEYLESTMMRIKGLSYREAHILANRKHNYAAAIREEGK